MQLISLLMWALTVVTTAFPYGYDGFPISYNAQSSSTTTLEILPPSTAKPTRLIAYTDQPCVKTIRPLNAWSRESVAARGAARYTDDLVKAAQKQFPGKAGKIEQHHVIPKYLGSAANGRTVPIDGAYHQQITNEFRRLWPYGGRMPTAQELDQLTRQVYEKFPLP